MAKITITLEDTPDGVMIMAHGDRMPTLKKDMTEAQQLALLIKEALEKPNNVRFMHKKRKIN